MKANFKLALVVAALLSLAADSIAQEEGGGRRGRRGGGGEGGMQGPGGGFMLQGPGGGGGGFPGGGFPGGGGGFPGGGFQGGGFPGGGGGFPGGGGGFPGGGFPGGGGGFPGGGFPGGGGGGWGGGGGGWGGRRGGGGGGMANMVRRFDTNANGTIEPSEVPAQMLPFYQMMMQRIGQDPNAPISIQRIEELQGQRGGASTSPDGTQVAGSVDQANDPNAVLGFGDTANNPTSLVPGFGNGADQAAVPLERKYDARSVQRADDLLSRYDRNSSGSLEREEWAGVPWSNDPNQSDRNQDGRLSREELVLRMVGLTSQGGQGGDDNGGGGGGGGGGGRGGMFGGGGDSQDQEQRFAMFAEGMIQRSDANRNGSLDGDELKEFRGDVQATDTNKDGKISKDELAKSFANRGAWGGGGWGRGGGGWGGSGGGGGEGESSSSTAEGEAPKRKSYKLLTAEERLTQQGKTIPPEFARQDTNGDGQIAMHEYSSNWTDRLAEQFTTMDRNGDGMLSPSEYSPPSGVSLASGPAVTAPASTDSDSPSETAGESSEAPAAPSTPGTPVPDDKRAKWTAYAKTQMEKYDANKDGELQAPERAKVRGANMQADTDGNGTISEQELIEHYIKTKT